MTSLPTPNAARLGSFDPKTEQLPEGAVLMTEREALNVIKNRVATWKPQEQVWALQLSPYLHAFGSCALGFNLYVAYKRFFAIREATALLLGAYGSCAMPAILTSQFASHQQEKLIVEFGTRNVSTAPSCSLCWQMRSALMQGAVSVGLPHFVAGGYFIITAALSRTYPVPNMLDYRRMGQLFRSMYAANSRGALIFAAINVAGTAFIGEMQQQQLGTVLEKLSFGNNARPPAVSHRQS